MNDGLHTFTAPHEERARLWAMFAAHRASIIYPLSDPIGAGECARFADVLLDEFDRRHRGKAGGGGPQLVFGLPREAGA